MPFDLQPFMENISNYGLVYSSKYDVSISTPPALSNQRTNPNLGFIDTFNTIMPFRAISCTTPGTAFMMNETNKWGIGPRIKQPYNAAFADIRITLLADSDGIIESYINFWMNTVYNYSFSPQTQATLLTGYRNDIASSVVTISKYDRGEQLVSQYILSNCIPTIFVPSPLDWGATNDLTKFTLGLNYTSYDIQ